jgi:hypothetical protein
MRKIISGVLLLVFLISFVGCGSISIPTEDGGKMSISKDGLSFEELTKLGENHCGVK